MSPAGVSPTKRVVCAFCGNLTGRSYPIQPFGRACPSCSDAFFSSRTRRPPQPVTPADLAQIAQATLGPPYATGHPLKIDVSDTGHDRRIETVGYGQPQRLGGQGLYVYRGPFYRRVFVKAKAAGDTERKRLNWHLAEWDRVRQKVAWIVWQETDGGRGKAAQVKGYWAISVLRAGELARQYQTPNGARIGPPLEAMVHYDTAFHVKQEPADLRTLDDLARLPVA